MYRLLILFVLSLNLGGCAGMFPGRTFIDEMDRETDGMWVPGEDFAMTAGDSGQSYRATEEIASRTPASKFEAEQREFDRNLGYELNNKIDNLDEATYQQFQRDRSHLTSVSEQIYYLNLSPSERANYIGLKRTNRNRAPATTGTGSYAYLSNYKGDDGQRAPLNTYYQSRYEEQALLLGMTKQDVVTRWGQPQNVEVAGHPSMQNERWSFAEQGKLHYVFFEAGRVQGWQLD